MAKLIGINGVAEGREYSVGELCIIGRSPNAQVRLPDLSVSRQHAKITHAAGGYVIEDLDSGLGLLVNEASVTVSPLKHNDVISIAETAFRFVDGPLDRVKTADFSLVYNEEEAQVVSVDGGELARVHPAGASEASVVARLTRRLDAILAVGRVAASTLETLPMLNEVLRHCLEVFPTAERALVAVPDRESQNLVARAMVMREGVEFGQFRLSRNITAEVLNKGRSVVSSTGAPRPGMSEGEGTALALMVAPLICRGQMLGLLYVDRGLPGPTFSGLDLEVLTGIAAQTALSLHNAQMHEALMRQLRIEQELTAAHEVQKRFMPRGVPKLPGFTFVAHYDPSRDVGGDLYDFITIDEDRVGIVVGDVSGKGFAAALVMAWVASQLRVAVHQEHGPAAVLRRVNESLLEARHDDLFVTLFYGVLDRQTMSIRFCSAGHIPPLLRRGGSGTVEIIEEGVGLPVGMVADPRFEEGSIELDRGDTVMVVSDGVTEAMDPQRRMFGIDSLRVAMEHGGPSATDLVSWVLGEVRAFTREGVQYDDITIVAVGADAQPDDVRATLPPGYMPGL